MIVADEYFDGLFSEKLQMTTQNKVPLVYRIGLGKQATFLLAAHKSKAF